MGLRGLISAKKGGLGFGDCLGMIYGMCRVTYESFRKWK